MEDSIVLQNKIRENSEDLQSFLRDMDHWEKEMKQKESELKLMNISEDQECPPIRNTMSRSKKRNRNKKTKDKSNNKAGKETNEKPEVRISAYNYKAWDKFDVESELKKVDDDEKKESSASESSLDEEEEISLQSKRQLAIIKKDNGNKHFKDGNYDSAINSYTAGMELDPENALLPANRAMAFLKKEQFQAAEIDCSLCLTLDPTYVKAYLRRGSARKSLQKLFLAKGDFMKALEMEPDNKEAQRELDKINKEINMESHSWEEDDKKAIQAKNYLEPSDPISESMDVQDEFLTKDLSVASFCQKVEQLKAVNEKSTKSSRSREASMEVGEEKVKTLEDPLSKLSLNAPVKADENMYDDIQSVVLKLEQTLPPVPSASFQFLTDWKKLSKYPELKYSYLKKISPLLIQDLFKNFIEPELFPEILKTLCTSFIENGDDVYGYLKSLSTVGRFSTMVMFLSQREKEDLKKLKSYLETSSHDSSEVAALMQLYGV